MERTSVVCPHCQNVINYKRCRNCNHFTPFYLEQGDGSYHRIDEGTCTVSNSKRTQADKVCVYWNGDMPAKGESKA